MEFDRKRDGLSFRPARLTVFIVDASDVRVDGSPDPTSELWDEEVNEDYISIGAKAVSVENEMERLGYSLKFKLEPVEARYGDGYFNSMLVLVLTEHGFADAPSVARCLERTSTNPPSTVQPQFTHARRDIESALRSAGSRLTAALGYDAGIAQQILTGAVAYYLDERFHITNRERLGFG
ncbi:hypothetical protein DB30_00044 [Enhygromyxa salina]|uniref:Uncharacterized protein n=1 Tax=Enhygromyxa salina TaxID=215803 RepID=A0A0C2DDK7_9BACT|nr:hypothetical protein DB30_00044 [Enhygromyxa salina]